MHIKLLKAARSISWESQIENTLPRIAHHCAKTDWWIATILFADILVACRRPWRSYNLSAMYQRNSLSNWGEASWRRERSLRLWCKGNKSSTKSSRWEKQKRFTFSFFPCAPHEAGFLFPRNAACPACHTYSDGDGSYDWKMNSFRLTERMPPKIRLQTTNKGCCRKRAKTVVFRSFHILFSLKVA